MIIQGERKVEDGQDCVVRREDQVVGGKKAKGGSLGLLMCCKG